MGWPLLLVLVLVSLVAGQVERLSLRRFLQHLERLCREVPAPACACVSRLPWAVCLFPSYLSEFILDSGGGPLFLKCCTILFQSEVCLFTF